MKKLPFILFSLVLGLIILAGCGEWLAKREAKRDASKQPAFKVANTLEEADSLLKTIKNEQGLPLDSITKIIDNWSKTKTTIYFDPTKCGLFPDLTPETVLRDPKYKALFGLTDDYDIAPHDGKSAIYDCGNMGPGYEQCKYLLRYKKIDIWEQTNAAIVTTKDSCLSKVQIIRYNILNEPEDVRITYDQALQIILDRNYDIDGGYWQKHMLDSLGYIPDAPYGFYPAKSLHAWRLAKLEKIYRSKRQPDSLGNYPPSAHYKRAHQYPKGMKFYFELYPDQKDFYYPKGRIIYCAIHGGDPKYTTNDISLIYLFEVATLYGGGRFVGIDVVTGEVLFDSTLEYNAG